MIEAEFDIFRNARRRVSAIELIAPLQTELRDLPVRATVDQLASLLLGAGEFECAIRDEQQCSADDAHRAASLTDIFAAALVNSDSSQPPVSGRSLEFAGLRIIDSIQYSGWLSVSAPEGFAYYALHPLDFADLAGEMTLDGTHAFVVGIRSIGTTLSAVVTAKLRQMGVTAERTTVRPSGHPYERCSQFDRAQQANIRRAQARNAAFLICDEGPGRSGSSFLSVAEALERADVPRDRILILCSHQPNTSSLCAPNGPQRWARYRSVASGMTKRLPANAGDFVGGGVWRSRFAPADGPWPAAWPQLERMKFLSRDVHQILKFEGHGQYGAQVRDRNRALADAGFGAPYLGQSLGFGRHELLSGRAGRRADLTPALLVRMAEYCVWRSRQFQADNGNAVDLVQMTRVNFEREFGDELEGVALPIERATICDGRMQPHEWICTSTGRWQKLDAATHGDDHFFPGPCDIAWDLAGIIVEWQLDAAARDYLLTAYQESSGDDTSRRIANYELAYATFRFAWSKMAAASVGNPAEKTRLLRDYQRYRMVAQCKAQTLSSRPTALQFAEKLEGGRFRRGVPSGTP